MRQPGEPGKDRVNENGDDQGSRSAKAIGDEAEYNAANSPGNKEYGKDDAAVPVDVGSGSRNAGVSTRLWIVASMESKIQPSHAMRRTRS